MHIQFIKLNINYYVCVFQSTERLMCGDFFIYITVSRWTLLTLRTRLSLSDNAVLALNAPLVVWHYDMFLSFKMAAVSAREIYCSHKY